MLTSEVNRSPTRLLLFTHTLEHPRKTVLHPFPSFGRARLDLPRPVADLVEVEPNRNLLAPQSTKARAANSQAKVSGCTAQCAPHRLVGKCSRQWHAEAGDAPRPLLRHL